VILGAGIAEPYFSVRFINDLHGSPQVATTAVAVAGATVMLAQGPWGRLLDRHGLRKVALSCLAIIVLVPLMWFAATDPLQATPIWLLNGLVWAGLGLATFNLLLAISTDTNRASVLAWVNAMQTPMGFVAPLAGGLLSERAGIPAVFLVSAGVLAICWLYFQRSFTGKHGASEG
jgi:MFS family permease